MSKLLWITINEDLEIITEYLSKINNNIKIEKNIKIFKLYRRTYIIVSM